MSKRRVPEVNAGSMADIAFLLLIFFLVTTTIDKDKGIARFLPITHEEPQPIQERNILPIFINIEGEFLVDETVTPINEISEIALNFIDNGGAPVDHEFYCSYCQGDRDPKSSDGPKKAVIAIDANRKSTYKSYILLQNELAKAYNTLRNRESQRLFGYDFTTIHQEVQEGRYKGNLQKVKAQLKEIKELYPLLITDAQTKKRDL
ncbi:biopolymer transporter ExbD [Dokdonia pacifica]|uniref:Biopolymer transport protein ExbD n=1 Tax=Dokdonia pacifica TaxID=1627892 RepID=A0A238VS99_9FLAO|nr:biopolymer transporter ExbD [Dokdonia pacifica]GGG18115.1 biopolymer transporter ExbD [Dokdonia pacifica]SNR37185.1 Biopolymer transport protein ExbD [Dokdonia pacifica]